MGKKRIGQRFVSNEGYVFVIVEYNGANDLWIEFQDEYKARVHTQYHRCEIGSIKNPYHKSLRGIGCLGLNKDGIMPKARTKDGKFSREYLLWKQMIERASNHKITVCDRWLVYANFLEDLPSIENYHSWLAHEVTYLNCKANKQGKGLYSLNTCIFAEKSSIVKGNANKKINNNNNKKITIDIEKSFNGTIEVNVDGDRQVVITIK